jgi:serine/threonine protein kinase
LYSPPESLGKERSYCKVSDVFQIGAVLWEMFYGKFDSARIDDSVYSKIKKRLKYPDVLDAYEATNLENETVLDLLKKNILFDSITAERQHVPKSITKLLKRCTAFDPSKRFESAASVRNALSGIVVPNWKMHNDTHYTVNGWRGKDYRISIETKKGVEKCYFESAATETANYRCVKSITTLKQAIEAINN